MSQLALLGGPPIRTAPWPPYPMIGPEEKEAVREVLESGVLSTFNATPGEAFLGGQRIRAFEADFAAYHGLKHAVAMNSASAALHAAVVACGVRPGEEIIVPPYTFTSTATCALMAGAIPVFADVEPDSFCLSPDAVQAAISPLTRAIIPVHLFGQPANLDALEALARRYGLALIEDCAQAPGALYRGQKVGTRGVCSVFSFHGSKHIATGEGGMLATNDDRVADVARLVRNHGEAAVQPGEERTYRADILGYGYRMTEFEAAIGRCQLRKLSDQITGRRRLAAYLASQIDGIAGLTIPMPQKESSHTYYVFPLLYDQREWGIPRARLCEALLAEGIPVSGGYVRPLYLSPLYQQRRAAAFSRKSASVSYAEGLCPVAERLHREEMLLLAQVRPPATGADMESIGDAFWKVWNLRKDLVV